MKAVRLGMPLALISPFHHTGLGWKESKIKEILENFI